MNRIIVLFVASLLFTAPAVAMAKPESNFGRMFAVVSKNSASDSVAPLNHQTNQELADLAQTMREATAIANPKGTTAGVTFFGQFMDHDLTLDTEPQPTDTVNVEGLLNAQVFPVRSRLGLRWRSEAESAALQWRQVPAGQGRQRYLSGPAPQSDGSAILVEHRNDENLIIGQMHLAILRLHNALVDKGMSFESARGRRSLGAYRYVVLNDYLPQIVGRRR